MSRWLCFRSAVAALSQRCCWTVAKRAIRRTERCNLQTSGTAELAASKTLGMQAHGPKATGTGMGCLRKHVHGFRRLWEGSRTHRQPESQSNSDGYTNKFAGTSRTLVSSDSILREQAVQSPCPETSPQSRNLAGSGTFASDISIADAASSRAIKTRAFTRRRPTRQRLAREDGFQHRRGRPRPQVDIGA